MEVKCWNCGDEHEELERRIDKHLVCEDCYEVHQEELLEKLNEEPDYPDTVRERHELFGGE